MYSVPQNQQSSILQPMIVIWRQVCFFPYSNRATVWIGVMPDVVRNSPMPLATQLPLFPHPELWSIVTPSRPIRSSKQRPTWTQSQLCFQVNDSMTGISKLPRWDGARMLPGCSNSDFIPVFISILLRTVNTWERLIKQAEYLLTFQGCRQTEQTFLSRQAQKHTYHPYNQRAPILVLVCKLSPGFIWHHFCSSKSQLDNFSSAIFKI